MPCTDSPRSGKREKLFRESTSKRHKRTKRSPKISASRREEYSKRFYKKLKTLIFLITIVPRI